MPQPMLASPLLWPKVNQILSRDGFAYVQPKIDGMRVVMHEGLARSRSWRVHPNKYLSHLAAWLNAHFPDCAFDGEVLFEPRGYRASFRETMSLRAADFAGDFTFFIFDDFNRKTSYPEWLATRPHLSETEANLQRLSIAKINITVVYLPTLIVRHQKEIENFEEHYLSLGAEGLIFRSATQLYRQARSTPTAGSLLKLKRFSDAEARVVSYTQLHQNNNPKTLAPNGMHSQRAHLAENKTPLPLLGALVCETEAGERFNIGSGFTEAQRIDLWEHRSSLAGRWVKYKYHTFGDYSLPRSPIFISFRENYDIGDSNA